MSDVLQLNHQAENTYEFDLEIEGLTTVEVRAWFVIIVKGMELAFPCTQDKNHFTCKIPPMPFVERTAYKGAVRLVADDYFFEVVSDLIVNVIGNLSFERSDMSHMKVKSTIDGVTHTTEVVSEEVEPVERVNSKEVKTTPKKDTGATVKTDVKRVETPADIAKRIMNTSHTTKADDKIEDEKTKLVKSAIADTVGKPKKKNIDSAQFKTPDTPEPQQKSNVPTGMKKKTQPTREELKTPKSKGKMVKNTIIDQSQKLYAEDVESDPDSIKKIVTEAKAASIVSASEKKFVRKGTAKKEADQLNEDKNIVIEDQVASFVNNEKSEREEKLRNILKSFTVAPESTATKTRFIKKTS